MTRMQDVDLCAHILGLDAPWVVEEVKIDPPSGRIDFVIGFDAGKRSLFRKTRQCPRCERVLPAPQDLRTVTMRHLNLGGMRTYLVVPLFEKAAGNGDRSCVCRKVWGKVGSRFSLEMEAHVLDTLRLVGSPQIAAKLAGVTAAEVREIGEHHGALPGREADAGRIPAAPQFSEGGLEVTIIDDDAPATAAGLPPAPAVPPESHPVWMRLINGETAVQTAAVGFKMLLEQIRLSITANPSEASRRAGIRVLRQYFIKYWSRLRADMEKVLNPGPAAAGADAQAIPAESDNCWQRLIDGQVPLRTDAVALKMLLERVRLSLGVRPAPAHRLAGARVLHAYFVKYRTRLRDELQQLRALAGTAMNMTPDAPRSPHVPAEGDSCWRRWLSGEIDVRTDIVALTMLLERVRLSLGDAPSDPAARAGARVLRQFFLKYSTRLRGELEQLIRAGTGPIPVLSNGGQVVEFVEVPPENHPNWQRLIDGELQLRTDAISLKMLLERIRLSLGAQPTEASRLAGARILRQYFIKYRARHRAELEQLKVA